MPRNNPLAATITVTKYRFQPNGLQRECGGRFDSGPEMEISEAKELLYLVLTNELEEEEAREVFRLLAESEELREALRETAELMGFLEENLPKAARPYYGSD